MSDKPGERLAGYIFGGVRIDHPDSVMTILPPILLGSAPEEGWSAYRYSSHFPLRLEDALRPGPFEYPLIATAYDGRLILLAQTKRIVDHVRTRDLERLQGVRIRPERVDVDRLVRGIVRNPQLYALTFIHARVSGFGTALNAVSLYGTDVGESSFFRSNLKLFSCHTAGIRVGGRMGELARIGADGTLVITLHAANDYAHVEELLDYIEDQDCFLDRVA
jgi:hypothetical protein